MTNKERRKPATLRAEQQQETRDRLVKATMETISSKGYQSATIDNITSYAGTGRATFYLHFRSKPEALMAGWQEIYMPQMLSLLLKLDGISPASMADIENWVSSLVSFWENSRSIALASNEAIALEPELAKEWFKRIWEVSSQLPSWSERNNHKIEDARLRLFMLGTYTEHVLMMWLGGSAPVSRTQIIQSLATQWSTEFGYQMACL
ncbi:MULTISPECIES: TetR/AcrR family transcriptional regulator [unclassified Pseudomonas]|uniref:TetR/AcrR family transcriptional regulator n=1 Tax=unclassified Pseudomonas TaxID=196821 RepID=UPI001304AC51|nr:MULTISPECIES: TetR/AcrR family transcriptional regulator [unclassified Pseudomonas]